jgi:hypothetical protein
MITNHQMRNKSSCPKIQCVENKDLIFSKVLPRSSKLLPFIFLHTHYKRHEGTIFHTLTLLSVIRSPPTSLQIEYSFKCNLRQPKSTEENILNSTSNLTMKQKMIFGLPIHFTHTTPINHNNALLLEIVHGKDLS